MGHKADMVTASTKLKVKHTLQDRSGVHMCMHKPSHPGWGGLCSGPLCSLAREEKRHLLLNLLQVDRVLKPEHVHIIILDN